MSDEDMTFHQVPKRLAFLDLDEDDPPFAIADLREDDEPSP